MNDLETPRAPEVAEPSPGGTAEELAALFVQARTASGLSQEEVARRLYLSPELIRKVDAGCFEGLPKPAYMKGYLRSYARLVGLSGDDVVARFAQMCTPEVELPVGLQNVTQEEVGSSKLTGPVTTAGAYGLVGIAVILLLVWGLSQEEKEAGVRPAVEFARQDRSAADFAMNPPDEGAGLDAAAQDMTGESAGPGAEGAPEGGSGDAARSFDGEGVSFQVGEDANDWRKIDPLDAGSGTPGATSERSAAAAADDTVVQDERAAAADALPVAQEISIARRQEGSQRIITVQAGGADHLNLAFHDECWLEVSDGNEALVYEDLQRDGDVVDLFGRAPFHVLVGRAQSVTIRFNDRPVKLVPNQMNNTARVELGN